MGIGEMVRRNEFAHRAVTQLTKDLARTFDVAGYPAGLAELREEERRVR